MHEDLQFELAEAPEWRAYNDSLRATVLFDLIQDGSLPLRPIAQLVAESSEAVVKAATWSLDIVRRLPLKALDWAVRLRTGTYSSVAEVEDRQNPVAKRYFDLMFQSTDSKLLSQFTSTLRHLHNNEIGPLGLGSPSLSVDEEFEPCAAEVDQGNEGFGGMEAKAAMTLGWGLQWRRSWPAKAWSGDKAAIFLSDVLSLSLGILRADEQLGKVFGTATDYDTYLISCATPLASK